jgi:DNA-binding Lrp family transcriptional regulator
LAGPYRTTFDEDGTIPVVDELDSAIIGHLQTHARQTNRELARAVGIAPSTCLERVRALRDRGVITGYHAEISLAALNRGVQALLQVQVRPLSRTDSLHAFLMDKFSGRPEIVGFRSSVIYQHVRKTGHRAPGQQHRTAARPDGAERTQMRQQLLNGITPPYNDPSPYVDQTFAPRQNPLLANEATHSPTPRNPRSPPPAACSCGPERVVRRTSAFTVWRWGRSPARGVVRTAVR